MRGAVARWEGKENKINGRCINEMVIKVSDERRHDQVEEGRGAQTPSG